MTGRPAFVLLEDGISYVRDAADGVVLAGLEHMDERYVKAVRYATKAPGRERPRMVLLADVAGVEAEPDHRVGTERLSLLDHPLHGMVASSLQNVGELLDLAGAGLGVETLGVALLGDIERGVDEDLHEPFGADHASHVVPGGAIRTDRGADDHTPVTHDLGRHVADTADVRVTVFLGEPQALGEMGSDHVAVQCGAAKNDLEEAVFLCFRGRSLPGGR